MFASTSLACAQLTRRQKTGQRKDVTLRHAPHVTQRNSILDRHHSKSRPVISSSLHAVFGDTVKIMLPCCRRKKTRTRSRVTCDVLSRQECAVRVPRLACFVSANKYPLYLFNGAPSPARIHTTVIHGGESYPVPETADDASRRPNESVTLLATLIQSEMLLSLFSLPLFIGPGIS